MSIQAYKMSSRDYSLSSDYEVTVQAWVFRDPYSKPLSEDSEEVLFEHSNILKLSFKEKSYDKL